MGLTGDHWLCGWRVRSAIPLPELLPWRSDDREPDVLVRLVTADPHPDAGPPGSRRLQIDSDGRCRVVVRDVATFEVSDGRDVAIAPATDPGAPGIRHCLLGTVFGILCHQRGVVPLHASCVRVGRDVLAFTGPSGIGKSSLAAALWRLGHPLISDDLCVLSVDRSGTPVVLPAFPRLRLWHDGVEALGLDPRGLDAVHDGMNKYSVPVAAAFDGEPRPLTAAYHLSGVDTATPRSRLDGANAFWRLRETLYRRRVAARRGSMLFADLSRIAQAVPHWALPRPPSIEQVGDLAQAVATWHAEP